MSKKNTEKCKTFSVPITKEAKRVDKNYVQISYKLQFIDRERFMARSLPNLVDNLEINYRHDNKKCEICGIKCKNCECCLEYKNVKFNTVKIIRFL